MADSSNLEPACNPGSVITKQPVTRWKRESAVFTRQSPTPAERRLWEALRAGRLAGLHFRRGQVIDGFIADFYCHAARLVVEVDGPVHSSQRDYDAERDRTIGRRGIAVMRVTNDEVTGSLIAVLERIRRAAVARSGESHDQIPATRKQERLSVDEAPPPFREGAGG